MADEDDSATSLLDDEIVHELARSRPWVFLIAIVLALYAGLGAAAGLYSLAVNGPSQEQGAATPLSSSVTIVLSAFLYAVPAIYLFRWARSIAAVSANPNTAALLTTLREQTLFLRAVGIIFLLFLIIAGSMLLSSCPGHIG